jgi:hypothetical protein
MPLPDIAAVGVRQRERIGGGRPPTDPDHAVGADPEPPVAERRHIQIARGSLELVDDQEVVPARLVLRELEPAGHAASR